MLSDSDNEYDDDEYFDDYNGGNEDGEMMIT